MGNLKRPIGATKSKKRLGRGPGTGNGTTAGKGTKGQNSRSGGGVRPGFEGGQMPLYRRIARRGFSNYPFKVEMVAVSLAVLEERFDNGATVSLETLREHGLISRSERLVKVLAGGDVTKKLTISGLAVSAAARAKIEAAGGTIEGSVVMAQPAKKAHSARKAQPSVDASARDAAPTDEKDTE